MPALVSGLIQPTERGHRPQDFWGEKNPLYTLRKYWCLIVCFNRIPNILFKIPMFLKSLHAISSSLWLTLHAFLSVEFSMGRLWWNADKGIFSYICTLVLCGFLRHTLNSIEKCHLLSPYYFMAWECLTLFSPLWVLGKGNLKNPFSGQ